MPPAPRPSARGLTRGAADWPRSVGALIDAINAFLDAHNEDPKVFTWHKDADTILSKVARANRICKEPSCAVH